MDSSSSRSREARRRRSVGRRGSDSDMSGKTILFSIQSIKKSFIVDFSARGGSKAGSGEQRFSYLFLISLIMFCLVASFKLNDSDDGLRTSGSRRSSSRKRVGGFSQYKSKDSTDSVCE